MKIVFSKNELEAMVKKAVILDEYNADIFKDDIEASGYDYNKDTDEYYLELDENIIIELYDGLTPEINEEIQKFNMDIWEACFTIYKEANFSDSTKQWLDTFIEKLFSQFV